MSKKRMRETAKVFFTGTGHDGLDGMPIRYSSLEQNIVRVGTGPTTAILLWEGGRLVAYELRNPEVRNALYEPIIAPLRDISPNNLITMGHAVRETVVNVVTALDRTIVDATTPIVNKLPQILADPVTGATLTAAALGGISAFVYLHNVGKTKDKKIYVPPFSIRGESALLPEHLQRFSKLLDKEIFTISEDDAPFIEYISEIAPLNTTIKVANETWHVYSDYKTPSLHHIATDEFEREWKMNHIEPYDVNAEKLLKEDKELYGIIENMFDIASEVKIYEKNGIVSTINAYDGTKFTIVTQDPYKIDSFKAKATNAKMEVDRRIIDEIAVEGYVDFADLEKICRNKSLLYETLGYLGLAHIAKRDYEEAGRKYEGQDGAFAVEINRGKPTAKTMLISTKWKDENAAGLTVGETKEAIEKEMQVLYEIERKSNAAVSKKYGNLPAAVSC